MKFRIVNKGTCINNLQNKNIKKNTYTHETIIKNLKWWKKLGKEVEMQARGKRKDKNRCKHQVRWKIQKELRYGKCHDDLTPMANKRNIEKKSSRRCTEKKKLTQSNNKGDKIRYEF